MMSRLPGLAPGRRSTPQVGSCCDSFSSGAVSLGNIAIHAVVMATVVSTARGALKWQRHRPWI